VGQQAYGSGFGPCWREIPQFVAFQSHVSAYEYESKEYYAEVFLVINYGDRYYAHAEDD